ncbi:hypothetical protein QTH89_13770 [Variovorax sp. J22G21]|uniref:hypothetical protein n=1 Tax=Variovorax fucosicus TaxID=3053517 RepID=UPI002574B86A|nr:MULTISPECIES: hypothetical protein [unclassified Variovorax]MDM0037488.1 hypothetical protein [Variovorax sp. J22R193]MDM0062264.1 hypothetical protein [Variovorax sp. J22G21]
MDVKHKRTLNDIRYFESPGLPSEDLPMPHYMGKLFTAPPSSVAFGQLIGGKCAELKLTISGGSSLYLLFTPAIPDGQLRRLEYTAEKWQTWAAYGLQTSFNAMSPDEQAALVRAATFQALRFLSADLEAIQNIADQYQTHGELLRVRLVDKTVRGHRLVVSCEVRPHGDVSRLWLEVTEAKSGRRADMPLTPMRWWVHGKFLAQDALIQGPEIVIRPRKSSAADYYTKGYAVPFRIRIDSLFPPDLVEGPHKALEQDILKKKSIVGHSDLLNPTIATRKPVDELSASDLEAFPVWEFAMDEEQVDEQDETWVKPVPAAEVPADGSSLSVAAALKLANGQVFPGVMFCDTHAGFDIAAVALLTTEGRVLFSRNDSPSEIRRSLKRLGLARQHVFPLDYCTRAPSARTGIPERGTFNA